MRRAYWPGIALGFLAVAGLAAACSSLSEDQCRQGDWAGIGQADGYAGSAMSRLEDHAEACRKVGITPDAVAYGRGRQIGLRGYCTPARGFSEGRQGHSYAGVCPPGAAQAFMAAYNDGRIVYDAVTRLNTASSARTSAMDRIQRLERQMRDAEAQMNASGTTEDRKTVLRGQITHLRRERREEIERARNAGINLREAEREVSDLRYRLQPRYPGW